MVRLFSQINNSTNAEELLSFPNVDLNKVNNNVDTNIVVSEEVDSESDDDEDDVLDEVDEEIEAQLTEMSKLNFSNSINNEFNEEEQNLFVTSFYCYANAHMVDFCKITPNG